MNRNRVSFLVIFIVVAQAVAGQEYFVQGTTPDLYLSHKVAAKETWYSIGRTFNISPKEIAAYNKLSLDKPLEIGYAVKVPLTSSNFSQNDMKGADEVLVPVYHVVQEKEWMYRISVNNNKVPIEKLEKWNHITADEATPGKNLIIGFLKVKGSNASAAAKNAAAEKPVAITKDTPRPAEEDKKTEPAANEVRTVSTAPSTGGYFKALFENAGKSYSGVTGIFKSTSGWNDGKYYALMTNVTIGTIIKVTFPSTSKSIYAKVLGELPEMKESAGLALRISDAAANELGATNGKFSVDISY